MFWAHLYNFLWEDMREQAHHEQDYGMAGAAWRRPLTGDEPRTFVEFMRRVFLAR
jgi:hypothetical protein